jgi:hypothetical protein
LQVSQERHTQAAEIIGPLAANGANDVAVLAGGLLGVLPGCTRRVRRRLPGRPAGWAAPGVRARTELASVVSELLE